MRIYFVFCSFIRTFGLLPKVLSFENENKCEFILYFAHLFVPLHPLFGKSDAFDDVGRCD